jgi:hypothetical protein
MQPGKMAKTLKCSRPKRLMAKNQAGQHTPSKNCSLPKARPKITQPLMQPWLFFVHPSSYRDVHRKEQQFLPPSRGRVVRVRTVRRTLAPKSLGPHFPSTQKNHTLHIARPRFQTLHFFRPAFKPAGGTAERETVLACWAR